MSEDVTHRLATAYAALLAKGKRPSVRTLKAEARCGTDVAAGFLADVDATAADQPAPPVDAVRNAIEVLWAAVWPIARDAARTEYAERADAALQAEAEAEAAREQAAEATREAKIERDEIAALLDKARAELTQFHTESQEVQLRADAAATTALAAAEQAKEEARNLRAQVIEADRRIAAAEATADTLRNVLDTLRIAK